jgi:catalase
MPYNPFDLTKVWPTRMISADRGRRAGAEPQPGELLPGCGAGRLQPGRQRVPGHRLLAGQDAAGAAVLLRRCPALPPGVNHHQIPVNSPKNAPAHPSHRDGQMRVDGNHGATIGYTPNSFGEWEEQPEFKEPPLELRGAADIYGISVQMTRITTPSPASSST